MLLGSALNPKEQLSLLRTHNPENKATTTTTEHHRTVTLQS
jgi:hypothetical protein